MAVGEGRRGEADFGISHLTSSKFLKDRNSLLHSARRSSKPEVHFTGQKSETETGKVHCVQGPMEDLTADSREVMAPGNLALRGGGRREEGV